MRENSLASVIQNKILLSGIEPMRGRSAFPELTSPGNMAGGHPHTKFGGCDEFIWAQALPPELARPLDARAHLQTDRSPLWARI